MVSAMETANNPTHGAKEPSVAPVDPFAAMRSSWASPTQTWSSLNKSIRDGLAGWEKTARELGEVQEQGLRRAQEAVEEVAKLWKASFGYVNQMSGQLRELGFEATRRTIDSFATEKE